MTSEFIGIWTLSLNTNASAHSSVGSVGRGGAGHKLCSAALRALRDFLFITELGSQWLIHTQEYERKK